MKDTLDLGLKTMLSGVGVYFGPSSRDHALNCYFDYLVLPVTRPLSMRKQNLFVLCICKRKNSNSHLFK